DPKGPNSGSNRQSRLAAQSALMQFYQQNRNNAAASRYVVEAAYAVAKMKKTAGERDYRAWLASTVTAWDGFHARSGAEAQKPPYVDYAAEAAFTLLDEEIASKFETAAKHQYPATVPEILGDPKTGKKGKYQLN